MTIGLRIGPSKIGLSCISPSRGAFGAAPLQHRSLVSVQAPSKEGERSFAFLDDVHIVCSLAREVHTILERARPLSQLRKPTWAAQLRRVMRQTNPNLRSFHDETARALNSFHQQCEDYALSVIKSTTDCHPRRPNVDVALQHPQTKYLYWEAHGMTSKRVGVSALDPWTWWALPHTPESLVDSAEDWQDRVVE